MTVSTRVVRNVIAIVLKGRLRAPSLNIKRICIFIGFITVLALSSGMLLAWIWENNFGGEVAWEWRKRFPGLSFTDRYSLLLNVSASLVTVLAMIAAVLFAVDKFIMSVGMYVTRGCDDRPRGAHVATDTLASYIYFAASSVTLIGIAVLFSFALVAVLPPLNMCLAWFADKLVVTLLNS